MTGDQGKKPVESTARRRKVRIAGLVISGATICAVAISWGVVQASTPVSVSAPAPGAADDTSRPATPIITAPQAPGEVGDETTAVESATSVANALVEASNELSRRADGEVGGLDDIASGFVWGELQALATERQQLGYRQIGKAEVTAVSVREIDLEASPQAVVLDVCVDASGIDIVDSGGTSMRDSLYLPSEPVLHVYGAHFLDGRWKFDSHEIPDGASCD